MKILKQREEEGGGGGGGADDNEKGSSGNLFLDYEILFVIIYMQSNQVNLVAG
jgi:hypothetical protein